MSKGRVRGRSLSSGRERRLRLSGAPPGGGLLTSSRSQAPRPSTRRQRPDMSSPYRLHSPLLTNKHPEGGCVGGQRRADGGA